MDAQEAVAAKRQYEEDGFYLIAQPIVAAEVVEGARQGMERLQRGEYNTGTAPTNQPEFDPQALLKLNDAHRADAQVRALITGRALPESELERLRAAILATPEVEAVNHLAAIHAGASTVVVDADLDLAEGLETTQIEAVLDDVEARVREIDPEIERVRVLLNSPEPPPPRAGEEGAGSA